MTKKDAIFHHLLTLLFNISTNTINDDFIDRISSEDSDRLISDLEQIENETEVLKAARELDQLPSNLGNLRGKLNNFHALFSDFPNHRIPEILLLIDIISKIIEDSNLDPNFNIADSFDESQFQLLAISASIKSPFFRFIDTTDFSKSILAFSMVDPAFSGEIQQVPVDLLFQLLAQLNLDDPLIPSETYLVIKSGLSQNKAESCLKLHLVKNNKYFHDPVRYPHNLTINPIRQIDPDRGYQQFNETLAIISEYNFQKDILDKYLRLYHIVENFMYRQPLVSIERKTNVNFSIRDFQRMYKAVNTSELDVLKEFLKKVFVLNYNPAPQTFSSHLFTQWSSLTTAVTTTQLDLLLETTVILNKRREVFKFSDIQESQMSLVLSQLIYSFRNSIVHNKDTEFHLTHETLLRHSVLGNTAFLVLERFLIPCIEEIVFYLVIEDNDIVRFSNSDLRLWTD